MVALFSCCLYVLVWYNHMLQQIKNYSFSRDYLHVLCTSLFIILRCWGESFFEWDYGIWCIIPEGMRTYSNEKGACRIEQNNIILPWYHHTNSFPGFIYCCFCTSYCVRSFKNPLLSLQIFHDQKIYPTNAYTKIWSRWYAAYIFAAANAVVMVAIKPIRLGSNTTSNVVINLYMYTLFSMTKFVLVSVAVSSLICMPFGLMILQGSS